MQNKLCAIPSGGYSTTGLETGFQNHSHFSDTSQKLKASRRQIPSENASARTRLGIGGAREVGLKLFQ